METFGPQTEVVCEGGVGVEASDDAPLGGGGVGMDEGGRSRLSCCHNVSDHQSVKHNIQVKINALVYNVHAIIHLQCTMYMHEYNN